MPRRHAKPCFHLAPRFGVQEADCDARPGGLPFERPFEADSPSLPPAPEYNDSHMPNEKLNELLDAIKAEVNKPHAGNQAVCPHCGRPISLLPPTAATGRPSGTKRTVRARRPGKRHVSRNAELPGLAMEYARRHFNGRISNSYAAVKQAIGSMRGKDKGQVRQAKIDWYRKQLSK